MAAQLIKAFQSKSLKKTKALPLHNNNNNNNNNNKNSSFNLHAYAYMIIKVPHCTVLRLVARAMILALIIVSLPSLRAFISASSLFSSSAIVNPEASAASDSFGVKVSSFLFQDLANEGLLKAGDKTVFLSSSSGDDNAVFNSQLLRDNDMDLVSITDMDQQSSIPDQSVDIAFTSNFQAALGFLDRTLKVGGIAVLQLSDDPSFAFNKPSNYKIVYFRWYRSIILGMRKTGHNDERGLATQRRLLGYANEKKRAALRNLEDVLLEPPRAASRKSSRYWKRTRYLPDLLGDSLESYPRRVFIDVGLPEKEGGTATGWFAENYPTRNLHFDMYKIETVTEELSGKEVRQEEEIGVSDWLRKNVKEEEYVVMKAEAGVVEEMVMSRAIRLVDELFLECKPRGKQQKGSRRAYWECLALYGKLRDEGVAVHQWWN